MENEVGYDRMVLTGEIRREIISVRASPPKVRVFLDAPHSLEQQVRVQIT